MLLDQKFKKSSNKAILLDLDEYVEEINPSWIWGDKHKEEIDQQRARENFAHDIDGYLRQGFSVIAIGERSLTKDNITNFIKKLKVTCSTNYLYHFNPPFKIRKNGLDQRGPCSLIDLDKDQRERDLNEKGYGFVYENISSPIEVAEIIMRLIQNDEGLLDAALC